MKEIEKLIRRIGFGVFGFFITSFFGAMLAPFVPGSPSFWTTCILWSAVITMILAPGMLIMYAGVGRIEQREKAVFPEPEPFDRDEWEGENPFSKET